MATFRAVVLKGSIHVKSDGTTNVKIRITHNRKTEYISTDIYIYPDKFKKGFLKGEHQLFVNSRITDYLKLYSDRYHQLKGKATRMTARQLKRYLVDPDTANEIDFLKFARQYLQELKDKGKEGSWRGARGLIMHLENYSDRIYFSDITTAFLVDFERYLLLQGVNDTFTYFARLRLIFNRGRMQHNNEDTGEILIPNYPFRKVRIKRAVHNANERSLTVAQVQELIRYEPKNSMERYGRDAFLSMICLIGINSVDLYRLNKPEKGRVVYSRSKTGRQYSIKIEPELSRIIELYPGETRLFNFSDRYQNHDGFFKAVNKGLKRISEVKQWQKVTTNWARHTWATIARNDCGISKDDVALCLGHKDTDNIVTDMYIRYDHSIVDNSNRKVLDLLFTG